MTTETALPVTAPAVEASAPTAEELAATAALTEKNRAIDQDADVGEETAAPKPEKTPEQRQIARLERKLDRVIRQREELRARAPEVTQRQQPAHNNDDNASSNEQLTLSRAELDALVNRRAAEVAPKIKQQIDEIEQRRGTVEKLAKDWGDEKFDALSSDLDDAFGGLSDNDGKPKPATDAIFESDSPKALIEYLADPEHAAEAAAISRMSALQAGRAIVKLELRIEAEKAAAKPKPSKAPAPIEASRGNGSVSMKPLRELSGAEFEKRRREQIAQRR